MLRRAGEEGKTQKVPFKGQGGDEGGSTYQIPLEAGDRQYSQHACREYGLPLLPVQKPQEVTGDFREGE